MATVTSPPILVWTPEGGVPGGPVSNPPIYSQAGTTQLIAGQSYIDVVFGSIQTDDEWVLVECVVVNEIDVEPLNIWPGIITDKAQAGFRLQLNGLPDSGNYYLHWAVSGINITPSVASTYYLTGPSSGPYDAFGAHSSNFTVTLPPSTTIPGTMTVTPDDGAGGTFSPSTVTLTAASRTAIFTYTPAGYGAVTINVTNSMGLIDPVGLTFTAVAAAYTLSGPGTGALGTPSTNFTVALPVGGVVIGTVTVTPHDAGAGTFTPTTVGLTTASPSATFTYTPVASGTKTISTTNNQGLSDPSGLSYVVTLPGHYRLLTINHTQVPGTQTNFPVLVSVTDATLKTIANGGHVQRSDGFDIGFFSDSDGTTPLKWEIEKYVPTTGELVAWVKIASVSSSADTLFYLRYGDPSITTDHSDPPNVWTNGYIAVYHFGNGTTLSVSDSLGANNGTAVNGPTATTGRIDGGAALASASAQYINVGHGGGFNIGGEYTFSAWINGTSFVGASSNWIVAKDIAGARSFAFGVTTAAASKMELQSSGASVVTGASSILTGTTYYCVISRIGTTDTIYLNAVSDGSATDIAIPNTSTDVTIGARLYAGFQNYWNGWLDEVRFSNVGRSANWITTEYNNQNAPGTFITMGAEV